MKATALHRFRRKLQANEPLYGLWVTLEAAAVSEIAVGLGFDWIVIDAAHGHLDWAEIHEHISATARSETVALVRLPGAYPELINRALELGADGVLVSEVETADELRSIIKRSKAPVYAFGHYSANATRESDASVLIVPVINLEQDELKLCEIIALDGVDFVFLDLKTSNAPSLADVRARQDEMVAKMRDHGRHAGIIAENDEALKVYEERKFRVLGLGPDTEIIRKGIQSTLEAAGRSNQP
jgi:2-keto-3-deoxy-L-rhamnonate aldolase RhmA